MPGGLGPNPVLICKTTGGALVAEIRSADPDEAYLEAICAAVEWQMVMTPERRATAECWVQPDSDVRMARAEWKD